MKTVIGLIGVKTSGKSTIANMIKEFIPNTEEVALADKLKNVCSSIFLVDRENFDKQDLKEAPFEHPFYLEMDDILEVLENFNIKMTEEEANLMYSGIVGIELDTPRKIAQIIGTEVLREAGDEDVHCNNLKIENSKVTVISDVRFPNEFDYFNRQEHINFVPLYIQRDMAENQVTEDSHPSEKLVFTFSDKCIKIDNNGELISTEVQVKEAIDKYVYKYK